jgi:DNA-3-methyladenine glycosylase
MGTLDYSPILEQAFFDQSPIELAMSLLGKVLTHRFKAISGDHIWLSAQIIETEAYYINERASHSSLGFTMKRQALFMAPGTIYMYFARGRDSLNFSAAGTGNGVLIKSGFPFLQGHQSQRMLSTMQTLNPGKNAPRSASKLCNGQTLLCRSLNLKVHQWDTKQLDPNRLRLEDCSYQPENIIQSPRLGIPAARDAHLPLRFVDAAYANKATHNPLKQKQPEPGSIRLLSRPEDVYYPSSLL